MRTLILASSFLFLIFGGVAGAQVIYMNCKFFQGYFASVDGFVENVYKDLDLSLILNKNKKTIISSNWTNEEKYLEYKNSPNEIDWWQGDVSYSLNTINGNLRVFGSVKIREQKMIKSYDYQCDKTQKKF